jgi:hypothetical protein
MEINKVPTEEVCIEKISNDLNYYYIVVQRGDIPITPNMKKAAFSRFKSIKENPMKFKLKNESHSLLEMSDNTFIKTQLQGWECTPKKYDYPFGWTKEQCKRATA